MRYKPGDFVWVRLPSGRRRIARIIGRPYSKNKDRIQVVKYVPEHSQYTNVVTIDQSEIIGRVIHSDVPQNDISKLDGVLA